MTRIIYDVTGKPFDIRSGAYDIPAGGILYLEVEVPEGKYPISVDVSDPENHFVVYEDTPKPETLTRLELLENVVNMLVLA